MGRYINWADVTNRYPNAGNNTASEEVADAHIRYAEAEVDGRLASYYTAPFSSNNLTAKDLAIDLTYLRMGIARTKGADELRKSIDLRFKDLREGMSYMVTTSGDLVQRGGVPVWGSHQDYHPVYGMGPIESFVVDSSQVIDEENARL